MVGTARMSVPLLSVSRKKCQMCDLTPPSWEVHICPVGFLRVYLFLIRSILDTQPLAFQINTEADFFHYFCNPAS